MNPPKKRRNAVEKSLDILMAFIPHNQEMGTIEISKKVGLHSATTSRILRILTEKGFLHQSHYTKRFALGGVALDLGRSMMDSLDSNLVQISKPHIDRLRDTLKETVVLTVRRGRSDIITYIALGPQRFGVFVAVGDRFPIHASSGGKAILAYSEPDMIKRLLTEENLFVLTPNTITDRDTLMRQLEKVRLEGFSLDNEEVAVGFRCFGTPIFNYENKPVAALNLVGPSNKIPLRKNAHITSPLKSTANKISLALRKPNR